MILKNFVTVVTEGCSGLGAATTYYLAKQGIKVAVMDTNKSAVHHTLTSKAIIDTYFIYPIENV